VHSFVLSFQRDPHDYYLRNNVMFAD